MRIGVPALAWIGAVVFLAYEQSCRNLWPCFRPVGTCPKQNIWVSSDQPFQANL